MTWVWGRVVVVYRLFRRTGFRVVPGMTCKTLAGRAEHTSSRTSPSPRGDIDPGSMKGICNGFRVKPGMTWVWDGVAVYGLFRRSGFRVKPGMTWVWDGVAVYGLFRRSGFRVEPGMTWVWGRVVVVYRLFCPDWIPGQARNDVGWRLGLRLFLDVGLGVSALRRAPLPAVCVRLFPGKRKIFPRNPIFLIRTFIEGCVSVRARKGKSQ